MTSHVVKVLNTLPASLVVQILILILSGDLYVDLVQRLETLMLTHCIIVEWLLLFELVAAHF